MKIVSPGAAWLKIKSRWKHGLRTAWYRDIVRKRILDTKPFNTDDPTCELHVLTSQYDWINSIWALKTFYFYSTKRYRLCIHDDGSLASQSIDLLNRHFPDCRIVIRAAADRLANGSLVSFPRCGEFRNANTLALKLIDGAIALNSDRMLLLDSDVLFFQYPKALIEKIDNTGYRKNCFNADFASAYTINRAQAKETFDLELQPCINSGLGLVHRESLNFHWIEEFLSCEAVRTGHFWRIEQTLFALLSSRYGVELLPDEYTLSLGKNIHLGRPFRHYVGAIRHLMYREGISFLVSQRFLDQIAL